MENIESDTNPNSVSTKALETGNANDIESNEFHQPPVQSIMMMMIGGVMLAIGLTIIAICLNAMSYAFVLMMYGFGCGLFSLLIGGFVLAAGRGSGRMHYHSIVLALTVLFILLLFIAALMSFEIATVPFPLCVYNCGEDFADRNLHQMIFSFSIILCLLAVTAAVFSCRYSCPSCCCYVKQTPNVFDNCQVSQNTQDPNS